MPDDLAIAVTLPKSEILAILGREINSHASLADLLNFNLQHEQWDLVLENLAKMSRHRGLIEACTAALLAQSRADS